MLRNNTNPESSSVQDSMRKLWSSFDLLRDTTQQVSEEATTATLYLKDQLKSTTSRFFSVIDSISDLVIIKDGSGKWTTANAFAQNLYGFTNEDFCNKTDAEIAESHPEYAAFLSHCTDTDLKAWESKTFYRGMEKFEIDGQTFYFDIIKTPIYTEEGDQKELIVIGRDVTELRKGEEKSRALCTALNKASDVILILDDNDDAVFCNNAFMETFGISTMEQVEKVRPRILDSEYIPAREKAEIWSTIKSNSTWTGCIKMKHADGHLIRCPLTITPIRNNHPEPIFYICTLKIKV